MDKLLSSHPIKHPSLRYRADLTNIQVIWFTVRKRACLTSIRGQALLLRNDQKIEKAL